jgi:hypothetical protein
LLNELLMKLFLLLLICVLCGSPHRLRSSTNQSTPEDTLDRSTSHKISITFIGTVNSIEPLGRRELRVIPVDFDPRFAITVHVEGVTPKDAPFTADTDQVFAVHSVAMLFGTMEEDIVGKKYRFKIAWNRARNRSRFSDLTVTLDEDAQKR